jgi:hypothetical protein
LLSFAGYVRNDPTSRTVTFIAMMFVTTAHVLSKTLASALIITVNGSWLLSYMVVDMALYLAVRIVRNDFRFWVKVDGALSWILSAVHRTVSKLLVDFTCILHFRHSFEVTGVLWLTSIVQNQAASFVAAAVYLKHTEGEDVALSAETLYGTLGSLLMIWVLSLAVFICFMDRSYLHTFYGTTTGPQFCEVRFRNAKTDESKLSILKYHSSYYEAFDDELKAFVAEHWESWMANQPEWFTENVIATVPDEYLKDDEIERLKKLGGGKRRRSSGDQTFGLVEGGENGGREVGATVAPMPLVGENKHEM